MKFRPAALAAALLLASPFAHADGGWYLAYDYGQAEASQPALFSAGTFSYTSGSSGYGSQLSSATHDQTDSAHRFEIGDWLFPNLAIEVSDVRLGEHVTHAHGVSRPLPVSCGLPCENSFDASPRVTVRGTEFALIGAYRLPHGLSLTGKMGRFAYVSEYDNGITGTNSPPYGNSNLPPAFHQTSDGTGAMYGVGVGWEFVEHWTVKADWENYKLTGGGTTFDVHFISTGVEYRF